jgi:hypothetical protein|eukprot:TRINITY_DN61544_c0_g1_i1.p1 TRINITY_DN61544_c0_g1~~TRINITY_DN61544_c0_g1_i1.p1  ORF type:complete len:315 (-),score=77.70 TRINITY_DN61544_c0_g1_i1:422-1366(-)
MDALNVAALRSICAAYFEKQVAPQIAEIKESQAQVRKELSELVSKTNVSTAPIKPSSSVLAELEEFRRLMDLKANAAEVPTLTQFDGLAARLDVQVPATCGLPRMDLNLEELMIRLEEKANVIDVPSLGAFKQLAEEVDKKASTYTVDELANKLDYKADTCDVSSSAQLERLRETVERKAKQQRELTEAVRRKADADAVPTLADIESIRKSVERHVHISTVHHQKVVAALEKKANNNEVATPAQIEIVDEKLSQKADVDEVPTIVQFEELEHKFASLFQTASDETMPMYYWMMPPHSQASWNSAVAWNQGICEA